MCTLLYRGGSRDELAQGHGDIAEIWPKGRPAACPPSLVLLACGFFDGEALSILWLSAPPCPEGDPPESSLTGGCGKVLMGLVTLGAE